MILTLAQLNQFAVTGLVVLFLAVCIAMILLILIQRPQGGGLSGAFGAGGGAGQTAFGTKTGDVLTLVTITIFILFLVLAVVLNFAARPPESSGSGSTIAPLGEQTEAPASGDSTDEAPAEDDASADDTPATDVPAPTEPSEPAESGGDETPDPDSGNGAP